MNKKKEEKTPQDETFGEASGEAFKSENLNNRLEQFGKLRARSLEMSEYLKEHIKDNLFLRRTIGGAADRLKSCGDYLLFRDYYTVNEVRLHQGNFCRNHLLCPFCASRRALKYSMAYLERLNYLKATRPELMPFFITVTSKDGPDLEERYTHFNNCWKKMNQQRRNAMKGLRPLIEMNKAAGGVGSFEVKIGSGSQEWHFHNHSTWLCTEKPYETRLSEEWKEITGDSFIVDVKPFDPEKDELLIFLECFVYALKLTGLNHDDNLKAYQVLKSKRMISSFGVFRGVELPENLEDDPLENIPYVDLLFKFIKESGYNYIPTEREVQNEFKKAGF